MVARKTQTTSRKKKVVKKSTTRKPPQAEEEEPETDETEEEEETTPRRRRRRGTGTGRRASRANKTPVKLTDELRSAAAKSLATFEEDMMEHETIGFSGASTRELFRTINGKKVHVGFRKSVKFDIEKGDALERRQGIITVQFR